MYLDVVKFDAKYPASRKIGSGTFGQVYLTDDGSTVVKVIKEGTADDSLKSAVREINVYSNIQSPVIAELLDFTFSALQPDGITVKLALPFGQNVKAEHLAGKVSWKDIAGDILSGLLALESLDFAHNDLKLANVIFYHNKVQIIDFGLVSNVIQYQNGPVSLNPGYTPIYRDIEVIPGIPISTGVELYCLADILLHIEAGNTDDTFLDNYPLTTDNLNIFTTDVIKQDFIKELISYPASQRKSIAQLLTDYPDLRQSKSTLVSTPVIQAKANCDQTTQLKSLWYFVASLNGDRPADRVRTLFLALQLYHRVYPLIFSSIIPGLEINLLCLFSCYYLAQIVMKEYNIFKLKDIHTILGAKYSEAQIYAMILNIIKVSKGIISSTSPWDLAKDGLDLLPFLIDIFTCGYNGKDFKTTGPVQTVGKNIDIKELVLNLISSLGLDGTTFDTLYDSGLIALNTLLSKKWASIPSKEVIDVKINPVVFTYHGPNYRFDDIIYAIAKYNRKVKPTETKTDFEDTYPMGSLILATKQSILTDTSDHQAIITYLLRLRPFGQQIVKYLTL